MRLWEKNKGLLVGVAVAAVFWLGFRHFGTGRVIAQTEELRSQIDAGLEQIAKHTRPKATPIADAEAGVAAEAKALGAVRGELDGLEFKLEGRFMPAERAQPRLYFEQELDSVREHAREGTVTYKDSTAPFGFKGKFVVKEEIDDLLKRLALADHFRRSAEKAGIEEVVAVVHRDIEALGGEGIPVYVQEYPVAVTVLAHERSLISLLYHLQSSGHCSPVMKLSVVVTKPGSGSFRADLELSALFVVRKKKPKDETPDDADPYKKDRRVRRRL